MHEEFKLTKLPGDRLIYFKDFGWMQTLILTVKDIGSILLFLNITDPMTDFWVTASVELLFYQKDSEIEFNMFI